MSARFLVVPHQSLIHPRLSHAVADWSGPNNTARPIVEGTHGTLAEAEAHANRLNTETV